MPRPMPDQLERIFPVETRDVVYESERTRVVRVAASGAAAGLIWKEQLGADGPARARNERRILERLSGVAGVTRLAAADAPERIVVFDDRGGTALRALVGAQPLAPIALVRLARRIALVVAAVHRCGVVHKDINPGNILLCGDDGEPMLIDFDLATTFAEDRPGFVHHSEIAGTLAYLAPEQTGRTGRPVDYRADLYALGVTLYELATGRLPFADDDPLQLIHDHLVRVPPPPLELASAIPAALSAIIMRLLEKEADRRYQSAEGLAHDLSRLDQALARGEPESFPLGARDFPLRLSAPSRLFGRSSEIAALRETFDAALAERARAVLVAGAPGSGKTVLIDELRPVVTARRGWFLTGKFDQYRHQSATGAIRQVMHALGRMLLAEPDAVLAVERQRLLDALGPSAGIVTALTPEFAALLGEVPQILPADPRQAEIQVRLAGMTLLRTLASPQRPLVVVVDDLQWAPSPSIQFIDELLADDTLCNLLLVGAYRDGEVDAVHPLSVKLAAWQRLGAVSIMRVDNLGRADLGGMLGEMLRIAAPDAARLADAIGSRTDGNPFDTVELVNALRADGVLVPGDRGWDWDEAEIRRHVGRTDVVELLEKRIAKLPSPSLALLQMLACLGGEVALELLQTAAGLDMEAIEQHLAASLDDGLLVMDSAGDGPGIARGRTVRFRHDRVQQAAHGSLEADHRLGLELAAARRLAALPGHRSRAAELYLSAMTALSDADEKRQVAGLFREAAAQARHIANYPMAERFLAAGRTLLEAEPSCDRSQLDAIIRDHHRALYGLGRFQESDELYAQIESGSSDPLEIVDPACVQIFSLCGRGQLRQSLELGLDLLRRLGLSIPEDIDAAVRGGLPELQRRWAVLRGEPAPGPIAAVDARTRAIGTVLTHVSTPAHFINPALRAWIALESFRLWQQFGSDAPFMHNVSVAPLVTIAWGDDYRTGYEIARHVVNLGEALGHGMNALRSRLTFTLFAAHWFEPFDSNIEHARRIRREFISAGEPQLATLTYYSTLAVLFECAETLEVYEIEVEAALAFASRTGNERDRGNFLFYRQMLRGVRGQTAALGELSDGALDLEAELLRPSASAGTAGIMRSQCLILAALFNDFSRIQQLADDAVSRIPAMTTFYQIAWMHLALALAMGEQCRRAPPSGRAEILARLDASRDWLAARAADNPVNFLHLLRLVEAERAWAAGEVWEAARRFDAAAREAAQRSRPWHGALIAERAGLFNLAHGMDHAGRAFLSSSHRQYQSWGASAKVAQLEREHPFLRQGRAVAATMPRQSIGISSDTIDLLAVLRASQTLSSETSLDRLQARVVELLGSMTGATAVRVTLWKQDPPGWYLPSNGDEAGMISTAEAGLRGLLPISAVQYAERTRETLLIDDVMRDPRFAADPYFSGIDCGSLLIFPILNQGSAKAMLILENRLSRGAFSTDRLEAVALIAGQLAVSFDNALLYASLERKVAERTVALEQANRHLEALSITDALTGLANRRRFSEVLAAEWQRAQLQGHSIGMLLIDVDHFKRYNDHYGHIPGDVCLQRVAAALGAGGRSGHDLVARYGGEEFAIIVVEAGIDVARIAAERARAMVAALNEPHQASEFGIVTVSIGVAVALPAEHETPEQLVAAADAALYAAKRSGRNQVSADLGESPTLAPAAEHGTSRPVVQATASDRRPVTVRVLGER